MCTVMVHVRLNQMMTTNLITMPLLTIQTLNVSQKPYKPQGGFTEVVEWKALIVEKGMTSGKTSIMLDMVDSSGQRIIGETSVVILEGLMAAIRGNEQRWASQGASEEEQDDN